MLTDIIYLCNGRRIYLGSTLDKWNMTPEEFDLRKLSITVDEDWSGVYYEGEQPDISLILEYNNDS